MRRGAGNLNVNVSGLRSEDTGSLRPRSGGLGEGLPVRAQGRAVPGLTAGPEPGGRFRGVLDGKGPRDLSPADWGNAQAPWVPMIKAKACDCPGGVCTPGTCTCCSEEPGRDCARSAGEAG